MPSRPSPTRPNFTQLHTLQRKKAEGGHGGEEKQAKHWQRTACNVIWIIERIKRAKIWAAARAGTHYHRLSLMPINVDSFVAMGISTLCASYRTQLNGGDNSLSESSTFSFLLHSCPPPLPPSPCFLFRFIFRANFYRQIWILLGDREKFI